MGGVGRRLLHGDLEDLRTTREGWLARAKKILRHRARTRDHHGFRQAEVDQADQNKEEIDRQIREK